MNLIIFLLLAFCSIDLIYCNDITTKSPTQDVKNVKTVEIEMILDHPSQNGYQASVVGTNKHKYGYEIKHQGKHFHHTTTEKDGVRLGCYGYELNGKQYLTQYVADAKGYRLVTTEDLIIVYPKSGRSGKAVFADDDDEIRSTGVRYIFPKGCKGVDVQIDNSSRLRSMASVKNFEITPRLPVNFPNRTDSADKYTIYKPSGNYAGPGNIYNTYLPPANTYLPPANSYLPPAGSYRPTVTTQNTPTTTKAPSSSYQSSGSSYRPPVTTQTPSNSYQSSGSSYGPPTTTKASSNSYQSSGSSYRPPATTQAPSNSYQSSGSSYRPPTSSEVPTSSYEPFGSSYRPPSTTILPPLSSGAFSSSYQTSGSSYRPPTTTKAPSNSYQSSGSSYRPPTTTKAPSNSYQSSGSSYRPPTTTQSSSSSYQSSGNTYQPPVNPQNPPATTQAPSNSYQPSTSSYHPPANVEVSSGSSYHPHETININHPPSSTYLPPPSTYLPPTSAPVSVFFPPPTTQKPENSCPTQCCEDAKVKLMIPIPLKTNSNGCQKYAQLVLPLQSLDVAILAQLRSGFLHDEKNSNHLLRNILDKLPEMKEINFGVL